MEISKTPSGITPVQPVAPMHNDGRSFQDQEATAEEQVAITQTTVTVLTTQAEVHTTQATVWAMQNFAVHLAILASQKEQQENPIPEDTQDPQ